MCSKILNLLIFSLIIVLSATFTAEAQDLPNSQVFVFHLNKSANGKYFLEDPRWISSFNPNGYNNQPAFINGWWLLSSRLPGTGQNEIVALDLPTKSLRWITDTEESEYSPSPIPGQSGLNFSTVRVETDSSQFLWNYQYNSDPQMTHLISKESKVGYTSWINPNKVALFLVNDPVSLVIGDLQTGKTDFITSRIGRCLKADDTGSLFFTQRITDNAPWQIKKLANGGFRPELITTTPSENEDFIILEDGSLLIGGGTVLYRFQPGVSTTWEFVADLALYGAKSISRLAMNKYNEIAIVFDYE